MFENGGPQEISVNVSPAVMRVLHSFLISDAPSMGPLNGNLNLVYELLAALEVFRPKNDNCLSAALAHIRELRGEAAPPSAAAKPRVAPPLCKNRHPCQWATLINTFNCDKCAASSLPGNHHWQCRGCDWDYCTNCVPEAGDPRGTALNGIAGVAPANLNIDDIDRQLQDLLRDL